MENNLFKQCLDFCRSHGVTEKGMEIVEQIVSSGPARRVDSRSMSQNYTTKFPSRKMGLVIQAESRTIELASIYLKEFDRGVLAYWDQPAHRVDLNYLAGKRRTRVQATMDFFVVSDSLIGFEECKPVEQLNKLCLKAPGRYRYNDSTAEYEIPPLDEYLNGTGLGYRVTTDKHINKVYVENLAFLYDFAGEEVTQRYQDVLRSLKEILNSVGGITIGEVEKKFVGVTREDLFKAIASGDVIADLKRLSMREPEKMVLAATEQYLSGIVHDEARYFELDKLPDGSPQEIEEALRRFKVIGPLLQKEITVVEAALSAGVSVRTVQRWKSLYEKNQEIGQLCSANRKKGNRNSKIPEQIEILMQELIDSHFLSKSNKKPNHIYHLLDARCREQNVPTPSKRTFYNRINVLSDTKSKKIREGAKSAYQTTAYTGLCDVFVDGYAFSEVSRFLERCHIDHTEMDVEIISEEGVNLGRPWLTLIVDEYTSYILAFYLSFDSPSVISLMCIVRLMVVNHAVFPEAVVVDGGKEFESIYFEKLMAKYAAAIISRKGKPRGGGAVEGLFGALDSMVTHNLTGNTKLTKNIRRLSASHNPKSLAVWNGQELHDGLLEVIEFFNESYPIRNTKSPSVLRIESIKTSGERPARRVEYNDAFYMHTLPQPKRPTAMLRRNRPIHVNRVAYWHPSFKVVPYDGVTVPLRYDPFNLNHVYIFYKNEWIRCRSVRPQHRKASDLDGAYLAEMSKRHLYLNDKHKESARADMAILVESLDEKQRTRSAVCEVPAEEYGNSKNAYEELDANEEEYCQSDDKDLVWDIDIPKSTRGDN